MVPSLIGPVSVYLIKNPFESQLSALKNVRKLLRSNMGIVSLHQPEIYFFFRETM